MRPIDADALKTDLTRFYDNEVTAKMLIDEQPTVDAIPVEWMQRRRDIYLKAYHAGHESEIHTAAILADTLTAWQKEQEAR